jgi:hypothetical protein
MENFKFVELWLYFDAIGTTKKAGGKAFKMTDISNPSICSHYGTRQILSSYLLKRKNILHSRHIFR